MLDCNQIVPGLERDVCLLQKDVEELRRIIKMSQRRSLKSTDHIVISVHPQDSIRFPTIETFSGSE